MIGSFALDVRRNFEAAKADINALSSLGGDAAFTANGVGAAIRGQNEKLREWVSLADFGAVGDNVTDDTAAIQNAINAAETQRVPLRGFGRRYKITNTIYMGLINPLVFEGGPGTSTPNGIGQCTTFDCQSLPAGIPAVVIGGPTTTRRAGMRINGLTVYKAATRPVSGSGSIGFQLNGLVGFDIENISAYGFDIGHYITTTATGGFDTSGGVMRMARFENNGISAQKLDSGIECRFDRCKFGEADYIIDLQQAATGNQPNGNQWLGGTAIASITIPAINCIRITTGFGNTFREMALEQSSSHGIYVSVPANYAALNRLNAVFSNVWMNGVGGIYCKNGNIQVTDAGRIRSSVAGLPTLTFDSDSSVAGSVLRSTVSDNYIGWALGAPSGLSILRYGQLVIVDNNCIDEGDTSLPFVEFSGGAFNNVIVDNLVASQHRPGYTGTIGTNFFRNRVGSGATAAEFQASDIPMVAGNKAYSMGGNTPTWQRSGTSIARASIGLQRLGGGGAQVLLGAVTATDGSYGAVAKDNDLSAVRGYGADGATMIEASNIRYVVDGAVATGVVPGRIVFETRNAAGTLAERLRIGLDGTVSHRGNAQVVIDAASHHVLRTYTLATMPPASTNTRSLAVCTDAAGGEAPCYSTGSAWINLRTNTTLA